MDNLLTFDWNVEVRQVRLIIMLCDKFIFHPYSMEYNISTDYW